MSTDVQLMIDLMHRTFQDFENSMPSKPKFVKLSFGYAYRFKEKDIYQAIILKLARAQSSVRAAKILLNHGFVQEQSILHRTIDETNEDIMFLVCALNDNDITELHERFLAAFWEEEIDGSGNIMDSQQKRPMIPRKKIQAYLAKIEGIDIDPSRYKEVFRTITKAYSGYVHGASPHIMEMYVGEPPHFHTNGVLVSPRVEVHANDLWNYVYRSFISYIAVGKVLGADQHVAILTNHLNEIEVRAGIRA